MPRTGDGVRLITFPTKALTFPWGDFASWALAPAGWIEEKREEYRRTEEEEEKKGPPRRFSKLRSEARDGNAVAEAKLRWYVQRRIRQGWNMQTIAQRLGITMDDVILLAGNAIVGRNFDPRPRLVK